MMMAAMKMWAPPKDRTTAEWADAERMLPASAAAEPGRWHTSRTEYLRGIMDAPEQEVVVVAATQVGKTECILNKIGHAIDDDPGPMLFILPDLRTAEAMSKERLQTMINATPSLREKVREAKARDSANTIYEKSFDGGYIALVGANSPAGLAMRPIRYLYCDEVDKYGFSAGVEGNPIELGKKRQETFWDFRTVIMSSPTVKGLSEIWSRYENSDQRVFEAVCPECQHEQVLRWANVKWDKGPSGEHLPETARYMCEGCGVLWTESDRIMAVSDGDWVATKPPNGVAGFHVPGFLSPWVRLENAVKSFLRAKGKPELMKTFVNTVLAECYEEEAQRFITSTILDRREAYTPHSLPDAVQLVTVGVDVQNDRLEMQVIGWGAHDEAWAIDYLVLHGDPALESTWTSLELALRSTYRTERGRTLNIRAVCIDSGFATSHVYKFCAARKKRRVFATKGRAGGGPIWPKWSKDKRAGGVTKHNAQVYIIGIDSAKRAIHARLALTTAGQNAYIHFPVGDKFDAPYFEQLAAEVVVTKYRKDGKAVHEWVLLPGRRNEALDTLVLCLAARESIPSEIERLPYLRDIEPVALPPAPKAAPATVPPLQEARKPFLRRGTPKLSEFMRD